MTAQPSRRPWPMKWIALAIVAFIVPYTWLTLKYRKPGPAYEPYADNKNRANVSRLLSAGYQRLAAAAERPAEAGRTGVTATARVTEVPGGLPFTLTQSLIDQPRLPQNFSSVSAPGEGSATADYRLAFNCVLPDNKEQLSGAEVYVREHTVVIVPQFEPIQGGLLARTKESLVAITLPAGTLKPGRYTLTLAATGRSRQWTVDVK